MRLVVHGPNRRLGAVEGDRVVDLNAACAAYLASQGERLAYEMAAATVPDELGAFIEAGDRGVEGAAKAVEFVSQGNDTGPRGERLVEALSSVKLHAPYARRARIMMAGGNYAIHSLGMSYRSAEGGAPPTLEHVYNEARKRGIWGFYCFPENAVGPDEDIIYPSRTDRLDYEGEVAVIIGKRGKDIRAEDADPYLWGCFLQNDVSARTSTIGQDNPLSSFSRGKNFDTSVCAGPYVVIGEFPDPQDISWETRVNGEVRQRGNTKDMTFSFAEYLEYMSSDMTLLPGDVISAGTTSGTAQDSSEIETLPDGRQVRKPDLFLKPGDVVELSNERMGTLRNRVVAKGIESNGQ
jgi:2-keto-4-pentenoate hydratase/2-oxohepta-3-ene-1,7-dioic acid hydratase in catechol pathway